MDVTQIPGQALPPRQIGVLRCLDDPSRCWQIQGGTLRIGRLPDNDLVISEPWVSKYHAEIFSRSGPGSALEKPVYFLKDMSRYWVLLV